MPVWQRYISFPINPRLEGGVSKLIGSAILSLGDVSSKWQMCNLLKNVTGVSLGTANRDMSVLAIFSLT